MTLTSEDKRKKKNWIPFFLMRTENVIFIWLLLIFYFFRFCKIKATKKAKIYLICLTFLIHTYRLYIYINCCAFSKEIYIFNAEMQINNETSWIISLFFIFRICKNFYLDDFSVLVTFFFIRTENFISMCLMVKKKDLICLTFLICCVYKV